MNECPGMFPYAERCSDGQVSEDVDVKAADVIAVDPLDAKPT
ncbi:hypothetical protein ACIQNG_18675 [Streptomyces sp. NPDC091377]